MKAKVIETGEIVDVHPNGEKTVQHRCTKFVTADGRELLDMELDFLPTIDWEQRRYEIAKDVMAASFAQPMAGVSIASYVHNCVQWADALIEELKKGKHMSKVISVYSEGEYMGNILNKDGIPRFTEEE